MSFVSLFRHRVANHGDKTALVYLRYSGAATTEQHMSYRELDRNARRVAAWLQARAAVGDRTMLLYPPGPQFAAGFLGCLYAGVIAVPAPWPDTGGRGYARFRGLAHHTGARTVLTESRFAGAMPDWIDDGALPGDVAWGFTDTLPEELETGWAQPELSGSTAAFLLYGSGSTTTPKGAVVTHGNLLCNQRQIQLALGTSRDTSVLGWLPHYHEMGLVGQLLHPLYLGGTAYAMSPMAFLKRPYLWLRAISDHRCSVSLVPGFAFDLAVRRITDDQLSSLDLSSLSVLCNGSGPIDAKTLRAFTDRFRQAGLNEHAMASCYGLAEATFFVTGTGSRGPVTRTVSQEALERNALRDATPADSERVLVSSGTIRGTEVRIVDPDSRRVLPDGRIGEIWLRGDNIAAGYWDRPEDGRHTFGARTACGAGDFLRTGDLGAIDGGELYVTGRLDDVLIQDGRNIYPTDIEHVARRAHPALSTGASGAFAIGERSEQIVLVHEVEAAQLKQTTPAELIRLARQHVMSEVDVHLAQVVLVPPGIVSKTTSGKVERGLMRDRFLAGRLDSSRLAAAEAPAEVTL
jgi:acyl-CoA synthetase (AMP-forming)/AMP-acid ligase II